MTEVQSGEKKKQNKKETKQIRTISKAIPTRDFSLKFSLLNVTL